ncbi:intermembrane space import and assembly protein 40, partial [Striga asiatica]
MSTDEPSVVRTRVAEVRFVTCNFPTRVMGQVESVAMTENQSSENSSLDSLMAEYGDEKALDCPCVAHLKSGPCGAQFSEAFVCFLKSTAEEKGSDCVHPFVALQNCIKANPDAFSKDVVEDDEVKEKAEPHYKLRPPLWSVETISPKE